MNRPPETLQIEPGLAKIILTEAESKGLTVDDYLKSLLGLPLSPTSATVASDLEEFMAAMESLAEDDVPPLPADFSREDIYYPEG